MRKILSLTLIVVLLTSSVLSVSAVEQVGIDDRIEYGVHIDSSMTVYENLEVGRYKAEYVKGYEDKVGSVRSMKDGEIVGAVIGKGYIDITENDSKVVAENMLLRKVEEVENNIQTVLTDGTYLVGQEIAVGRYKVENLTDSDGIIHIFNNLRLDTENKVGGIEIVGAGETIEFEVKEGHYAVNLFNVKLTRVE